MKHCAMLLFAVMLASCVADWSGGGTLHYQGSDPVGPFAGEVTAKSCSATFDESTRLEIIVSGNRRGADWIGLGSADQGILYISARWTIWTLRRASCTVFDVRHDFDAGKHLHVSAHVDCTSDTGVHVWGAVEANDCDVRRP